MIPGDAVAIDGVIRLNNAIEGETIGSVIRLGQNPVIEPLNVTENGTYEVPEGVGGFNPVTVAIPEYEGAYTVEPSTEEQTLATAGKVMTEDVTVGATELYGLWTDIIGLYAGRNSSGLAPFTPNSNLDKTTGELIAGDNGVLETYLRVKPEYRYQKSGYRIYGICYYDKEKRYIGWGNAKNNLTYGIRLDPFPEETEYIRVITHNVTNNWPLQIIRIE